MRCVGGDGAGRISDGDPIGDLGIGGDIGDVGLVIFANYIVGGDGYNIREITGRGGGVDYGNFTGESFTRLERKILTHW